MNHEFDPDLACAGKICPVMIWRNGDAHQAQMKLGFRPTDDRPLTLLRAERWAASNPCLILMNELALKPEGSNLKYAAALITDEPFFYVAGMRRPADQDWPASFAALTVPAYPDLAPYKDRHMAVVRPEDWFHSLAGTTPKEEIIRPFPVGSFRVIGPPRGRHGKAVADLFT